MKRLYIPFHMSHGILVNDTMKDPNIDYNILHIILK